jgi:hypothetical protein
MPKSRSDRDLRVFVSSTSEDLREYRAVARLVILNMGWKPEMMEHFGAMPTSTVQACIEKLQGCDLMILIVAFRRGWVPTTDQGGNGQNSITAQELDYARKHSIPVIAMLASETWPQNLCEDDSAARAWIKKFRSEINLPADFFEYESPAAKESERLPTFRTKLNSALLSYRERLLEEKAPAVSKDQFDSASAALRSGRCIPFLGPGLYGDGPLSTNSLIGEFGDVAAQEGCLATAAEYKACCVRSREEFLSNLERILTQQAQQTTAAAVHDLLMKARPSLIVNMTADLVLEERLAAAGKPPLILCHIISSVDRAHDGKILLFHGPDDDAPVFCPADEVTGKIDLRTARDSYIIYKPLGSPLLHRRLDPDLGIDTVVMTESDHLVLLGRMKNQSTGIPTMLSRYFQRYPCIFLGYTMDVWQYRLIGQVFQTVGETQGKSTRRPDSLAVRIPSSPMEEQAWRHLYIELLQMDPNDFARKVCEML